MLNHVLAGKTAIQMDTSLSSYYPYQHKSNLKIHTWLNERNFSTKSETCLELASQQKKYMLLKMLSKRLPGTPYPLLSSSWYAFRQPLLPPALPLFPFFKTLLKYRLSRCRIHNTKGNWYCSYPAFSSP